MLGLSGGAKELVNAGGLSDGAEELGKRRGLSGGAKELGKLSVPGRPTNFDYSRARAYCACSSCGWGMLEQFFSRLSFLFSFFLSVSLSLSLSL